MSLPYRSQLVAFVAQRICEVQVANRRWWQPRPSPFDLVPMVREVVGILLYDPEAQDLLDLVIRERDV